MSTATVVAPRSRIESEVLKIRGLVQQKRFEDALRSATALLGEVPENRDVLYLIAVSQRYLRRLPEALATLARFERIHPQYSRLYQERGHCYVALQDAPAALDAYLRAVNLNPALPASWKALDVLFRATGNLVDAAMAAGHVAKLATLPVAVVTATSMFADGETFEAERVIREFLRTQPTHIEAMRLLAQIGMRLDVLDDAEYLLESVLEFAPDYHLARVEYVEVLLRRHQHTQALDEIGKLMRVDPHDRTHRTMYANVCVALGKLDEAVKIYRELIEGAPNAAHLHLSIAHALKTRGDQAASIEAYHAAAAAHPGYGDAYWSLANLKTYRFNDAEIRAMREFEAASTSTPTDRYHLCFALGKALEDRAQYAEAFDYYARGNALKKAETRYQPEGVERNAQLQAAICTREFFASRAGFGCDSDAPIFIVGLPRAGSTLLEQILASHSAVEGTMELADIPRLVNTLHGRGQHDAAPRYPAALSELSAAQCRDFGQKYLADTQAYRTGKPYFIDKMPNNFRHIGLIHLILPNAKIIDARREPMACCFSNFKQLFASGQEFTYGIEDIARYYRSYVALMDHWDRALPGKILRVQHEEVVDDLDGNVRRLLDFCGLDFEPACLEFYKTARSIRTASSEQVRRPIYKEGLDQWRHFEPWLAPLRNALESAALPA